MKRTKWISILMVGVLAVAAIVGASAYSSVQAAAPAVASANGSNPGKGLPGGTDQQLADALGITVEKLQAAYQTATAEALKQAVSQGLITQEQADQMAARGGRLKGLRGVDSSTIDYDALLAKALGIDAAKLQAAYQAASTASIDQAVKDGKLTEDQANLMKGRYALQNSSQYQSAMQSAFEAAVKQAVANGVITQAQADQILKNGGTGKGFEMPGFGGRGGLDEGGLGRGGRGHGGLPGSKAPDAASPTPSGSGT